MSGQFIQFGLSLIAVLAIVACAHWLGFSREGRIESEDEARELFLLAAGGFEPVEVAVDAEGLGAIGKDQSGRLAMLVPHGNRFVVRLAGADARFCICDDILHVAMPASGIAGIGLRIGSEAARFVPRGN